MSSGIGYACINTTLGINGKFKTITASQATRLINKDMLTKIKNLSLINLTNTLNIIKWNIKHNIRLYRLTSGIIPLATHPLLTEWQWDLDNDIIEVCNQIKDISTSHNLRLSFHPDHYTVINSPREDVVKSSIKSLEYHTKLSDMIGSYTLVIHVGGVYDNKKTATERFISAFNSLRTGIRNKIILENDDKSYNIADTLSICKQLNIPMCLDYHHNRCNPSPEKLEYYIEDVINTWNGNVPKLHLSTGRDYVTDKSHSDYILQEDFDNIRRIYPEADVMLECKAKELAIFKLNLNN